MSEFDIPMNTVIGIKAMRVSEMLKIHRVLDPQNERGMPFDKIKLHTGIEEKRLRELLERYHLYFTAVGQTGRFILNRHYYGNSNLEQVLDSVERRNVRAAIARFTPVFVVAVIIMSALGGFTLQTILNRPNFF